MANEVKTGIEVQLELTALTRKIGVAFNAPGMYKIKVDLDGTKQAFPLPGPHFVACAPGEHALTVELGDFLGPLSLTALLTRKSIKVAVAPGETVTVRLHGNTFTSGALEIVKRESSPPRA